MIIENALIIKCSRIASHVRIVLIDFVLIFLFILQPFIRNKSASVELSSVEIDIDLVEQETSVCRSRIASSLHIAIDPSFEINSQPPVGQD